MSYITARGEVVHQDRLGFDKPPALHYRRCGQAPAPSHILARADKAGTVVWAVGNQVVIEFSDKARLHFWLARISVGTSCSQLSLHLW
jgi:hypothetical protein